MRGIDGHALNEFMGRCRPQEREQIFEELFKFNLLKEAWADKKTRVIMESLFERYAQCRRAILELTCNPKLVKGKKQEALIELGITASVILDLLQYIAGIWDRGEAYATEINKNTKILKEAS